LLGHDASIGEAEFLQDQGLSGNGITLAANDPWDNAGIPCEITVNIWESVED
jgi:hypothetical protein